ncbi:hypothetical protein AUP42_10010 [Thalassospira lucentensis]|uniref:Uncharacterized protein n=1 Tax=Thalassospira lucentensis TaxID=168935 RepID=A0A154LB16_9PROT|nr:MULTISPECIES: hypothetical protein [Thalassospira]KZB69203.1 hypothetical protein AUP42_10010 [Thalassospira lucentensis]MCH2273964.1 hypothetical protein [Thalassospira sp.]
MAQWQQGHDHKNYTPDKAKNPVCHQATCLSCQYDEMIFILIVGVCKKNNKIVADSMAFWLMDAMENLRILRRNA